MDAHPVELMVRAGTRRLAVEQKLVVGAAHQTDRLATGEGASELFFITATALTFCSDALFVAGAILPLALGATTAWLLETLRSSRTCRCGR
ncbi:MAG: hypothetical protein JWN04_106 [Myxococcaceae bacterium]|nr:hypothetical protein [Myxococcaceae bacterium]